MADCTQEVHSILLPFTAESIEWFREGQAFSPSCDLAPRPAPPPSFVSKLDRQHTGRLRRERRGKGVGEEQESLVLYKSFNTLCSTLCQNPTAIQREEKLRERWQRGSHLGCVCKVFFILVWEDLFSHLFLRNFKIEKGAIYTWRNEISIVYCVLHIYRVLGRGLTFLNYDTISNYVFLHKYIKPWVVFINWAYQIFLEQVTFARCRNCCLFKVI